MTKLAAATADQQDKKLQTPVGNTTAIAIGSAQANGEGVFVGYEDENYIIVRLPPDFNDIELQQGQRLRLDYDFAGVSYGYEASVLHYLKKFGLVFLSHPRSVEANPLRREDRIRCRIPATANFQSRALKGLVTDISRHGCQFRVKIPEPLKLQQVSVIREVDLSFFLTADENPKPLKGKVRNTNFDKSKIVLGIEFDSMEKQYSQQLEGYIERLRVL